MMLLVVGASHQTAPVEVRERLAFGGQRLATALQELVSRFGWEAVILSTCNRVEVYVARLETGATPSPDLITEFLAEVHGVPYDQLRGHVYSRQGPEAIRHLFRVAASLDSLVLGEGQIAGQVQQAYEAAQEAGSVGSVLHALFQHARQVSKRIRSETGVAQGKVSVSSLAVDYVTQVFAHFDDKTMLVIGAGKMGELTLKHLKGLRPERILVTNRSAEKAQQVAAACGGSAIPFEDLDIALTQADIVLSTTGAPEPIVSLERFQRLISRRDGRHMAIIDIAVPRDFDPRISDLELVDVLVNIDDLKQVRERVLQGRLKHLPAAEAIVQAEQERFQKEWSRRTAGPVIARLSEDWDAIRRQVQSQCFAKLNGKLSPEDQAVIEGAFKLLQNKLLHGPITALRDEAHQETGRGLLEAIYKLFRLRDM